MQNRQYDLTQPPGSAPTPAGVLPGASNKQLNFLTSLLQEREISDGARDALSNRLAAQIALNESEGDSAAPGDRLGMTKRRASEFITRLLEAPKRVRELPRADVKRDILAELHPNEPQRRDIPEPEEIATGRYAIDNADGELRFYRLWRGTRNPNYVKLYIQHGPDESEVQPFPAAVAIIKKIVEAGPLDCARRYGREIGACSRCGRRLTNRVSRLLSIGPICGRRFHEGRMRTLEANARDALRAAGLDPDADVEDTDDLDRIREDAGL